MRYAIYFTPAPASLLHQLASSWLGHDAYSGAPVGRPDVAGLQEDTAEATRYGFHATLKPPFALNPGMKREELGAAVAKLAEESNMSIVPRLAIAELDGFLALVPELDCLDINRLASRCVRNLDRFRAPASGAELARRHLHGLTPRQEEYLQQWGYPFVLEEFRFHLTLSNRLDPARRKHMAAAASEHFAPILGKPCDVDALAIFAERYAGDRFVVEERFPLRSAAALRAAS
jgi:putative phosphonate metabolism protein